MFAEILNGKINHYRGDTISTPIYIYEGNKLNKYPYYIGEEDTLYLGIMEPNQAFEDAIIKKKYNKNSKMDDKGNIIFELKSKDTQYLANGPYYYMLKLVKCKDTLNESVTTLIQPTIFNILGTSPTIKEEEEIISNKTIILDGGEIV